jgi:hypothetical protein
MTDATLMDLRIRAGICEAVVNSPAQTPRIEVTHLEQPVAGLQITEIAGKPGHWFMRLPIPSEALNDGVQTFLIRDLTTQSTLSHFTIIAGVQMDADFRAEIDLLRAELDLLKRAFRRHCLDTTG